MDVLIDWLVQILKFKKHARTQMEIQMDSYAVGIMELVDIKIAQTSLELLMQHVNKFLVQLMLLKDHVQQGQTLNVLQKLLVQKLK